VWSRPNKGVNARAARDIELEAIARPTIETSYAILERKSRIYEQLDKGKDAGLSEKQFGSLLVDVGIGNFLVASSSLTNLALPV
jgi:hypothetical protein